MRRHTLPRTLEVRGNSTVDSLSSLYSADGTVK
jgi:hypothetical protein